MTTTFSTGTGTTAPTVAATVALALTSPASVAPANASTNVGRNISLVVSFSESMSSATTQSAFCLFPSSGTCASNAVSGVFSWTNTGQVLTFDVEGLLDASTTYKLTIANSATDIAGNALTTAWVSTFTTAAASGPDIESAYPFEGQVNVDPTDSLRITFTLAMNTTNTQNAFTLYCVSGGCTVGTVTNYQVAWSGGTTTMTITCSGSCAGSPTGRLFANNSRYRYTVGTGATATAGAGGLSLVKTLDVSFVTSTDAKDTSLSTNQAMPGGAITASGSGWGYTNGATKVEIRWDDWTASATSLATVGAANCSGATFTSLGQ